MRQTIMAALAVLAVSGAAVAEPLTRKAAQEQLFEPKGIAVVLYQIPGVDATTQALLKEVIKGYSYYAAVAIAPGEELLKSEATMLVGNQHSVEAATSQALARCNAVRKEGPECQIAVLVQPANWQARGLSLSSEATAALADDYGRFGERALAIAPQDGVWSIGRGKNAAQVALNGCAGKGGAGCTVVVSDR